MPKKLKNWLIRKLGGHTQEYVNRLRETARRNIYKAEALEKANERMISWFTTPVLKVGVEQSKYRAEIAVAMEDNRSVDGIKFELCRNLAEKLMADKLVAFDIADDCENLRKILKGTITLLLPAGYLADRHGERDA